LIGRLAKGKGKKDALGIYSFNIKKEGRLGGKNSKVGKYLYLDP